MSRPLVTITDRALPRATFSRLEHAVRALSSERLRSSYQTTFWYEFGATRRSLIDPIADRLARLLPSRDSRRIVGVEWWLSRMRTSNVKVDFHVDRDNARFDQTRELVHPVVSSLLYLTTSVGGLLAVTRDPVDPRRPAFAPKPEGFDLVEPRPNRFVFFDGGLTHGVLDANNEIPLRRIRTQTPWRIAVAINFWAARPWSVPTFSEADTYRRLALGRRSTRTDSSRRR